MQYLITKSNGKAMMVVRTLKEAKKVALDEANKLNHSYKHNGVEIFADDDPDMRTPDYTEWVGKVDLTSINEKVRGFRNRATISIMQFRLGDYLDI